MRTYRRRVNGQAIRALREALGWNFGKFATAAGVSESFLSRIENGKRQPSAEVRRRIADALGVPVVAIIGDHDLEEAA